MPVYAAGYRQCPQLFDPVVKLGASDGKCCLVLAVELFAVAPESLKRRESNNLIGLPQDLSESRWLAEEISAYLQLFFGDVWSFGVI